MLDDFFKSLEEDCLKIKKSEGYAFMKSMQALSPADSSYVSHSGVLKESPTKQGMPKHASDLAKAVAVFSPSPTKGAMAAPTSVDAKENSPFKRAKRLKKQASLAVHNENSSTASFGSPTKQKIGTTIFSR
jgi:hypothetical protein